MSDPAARDTATGNLSGGTRLALIPLSVVEQGDGFIVGNTEAGTFVVVPPIAVAVIERLRAGGTIETIARELHGETGEDVDVLEFAGTLLELGFVSHVDGVPARTPTTGPTARRGRQPRWIRGPRPEAVRWLFGPVAWTLYAAAFLASVAVIIAHPPYRADADAFFFLEDPVVSIAILVPVGFATTAGHEAFHWLAACREGVAARFGISRRLYFLVFQTDLTQLWSIPANRRYGPLLAGMAFSSVLLSGTFAGRALIDASPVHAPLASRFLAAVGAMLTVEMAWQFCIFMRNDLYAVMITALGCTNLWRVTMLVIRARFGLLSEAGKQELAGASPRDRRAARWYSWLCLVGVVAAGWFAVTVIAPALWRVVSWMGQSLMTFEIGSLGFWTTMLLGTLALLPHLITAGVFLRQVTSWAVVSRRSP